MIQYYFLVILYIILYCCWLWWKYYSVVGVGVAGWIYCYIVAGGVTSCSVGGVGGVGCNLYFFDIDSVGVVAGVGIIGYVLDAFLVYVFSPGVIGYMNN